MAKRTTAEKQWDDYARQSGVAKQRAMDRLAVINQVEELMKAGITKSAAVSALASIGNTSAASIWNWLGAVSGISRHDRLAYLAPRLKGGGRMAAVEVSVLDRLAADYLRPERPSWADCVRRVQAHAERRGVALPHARTLWRRFCSIYDRPTMALHRGDQLPHWLIRRLPANDH